MREEVIATNLLGAVESTKIAPPAFKNKIGATSFLGEKLQFSSNGKILKNKKNWLIKSVWRYNQKQN